MKQDYVQMIGRFNIKRYPRYQPLVAKLNDEEKAMFAIWDNLNHMVVANSIKASFDLADQACEVMNDQYEAAMERQHERRILC